MPLLLAGAYTPALCRGTPVLARLGCGFGYVELCSPACRMHVRDALLSSMRTYLCTDLTGVFVYYIPLEGSRPMLLPLAVVIIFSSSAQRLLLSLLVSVDRL